MTSFAATQIPRRHALSIGGLGAFGLTLPSLMQASEGATGSETARGDRSGPTARAKSVIFLFQFGGPSHLETFDMKPEAPEGIRGEFRPIRTNVPGTAICEHLPTVAKIMDQLTVVRSVHHSMKNHNSAAYYALTGHAPPVDDIRLRDSLDLFPAYGSVVDRLTDPVEGMPTFVAYPHVLRDGAKTPGQHGSFLGKRHDPLLILEDPNGSDFKLPALSLPREVTTERLQRRRAIQQVIDRQSRLLETSAAAQGLDQYYQRALSMLTSPRVRKAFDLSAEPEQLRDRYGRHTYGQSCLLARRLVESGVRFVNVYFDRSIGGQSQTSGGWDTHGFNNTRQFPILKGRHLPMTDRTLPALVNDLSERGLLEETLVIWMGEFGRTPKVNKNVSRDHWPNCYTVVLAGGGLRGGAVYGASDRQAAFPAEDPVSLGDLAATMFYLLGIDPQTEVYDPNDRPLTIASGDPIHAILA